jgi:hypothetical protein
LFCFCCDSFCMDSCGEYVRREREGFGTYCASWLERRASDKCQREKRKTINGDDLLWAMSTLGFEEYVEPLKVYLHKYREVWYAVIL